MSISHRQGGNRQAARRCQVGERRGPVSRPSISSRTRPPVASSAHPDLPSRTKLSAWQPARLASKGGAGFERLYLLSRQSGAGQAAEAAPPGLRPRRDLTGTNPAEPDSVSAEPGADGDAPEPAPRPDRSGAPRPAPGAHEMGRHFGRPPPPPDGAQPQAHLSPPGLSSAPIASPNCVTLRPVALVVPAGVRYTKQAFLKAEATRLRRATTDTVSRRVVEYRFLYHREAIGA